MEAIIHQINEQKANKNYFLNKVMIIKMIKYYKNFPKKNSLFIFII
jgi:hypothetical protein